MNRTELINMFKTVAKNHSPTAYSDDLITHFLDEGQIDLVLRTGCYTATKTIPSVLGERVYKLGDDIMRILWVAYDGKQIEGTSQDQAHLFNDYPSEGNGTPTYYFVQQNSSDYDNEPVMILTPPPDASSETITVHYLKRPPAMWSSTGSATNDPVIPEQYHRLIVEHALYNALWRDVKFETADRWKRQYEERASRMAAEMNSFDKKKHMRWVPYSEEHRQRSIRYDMRD